MCQIHLRYILSLACLAAAFLPEPACATCNGSSISGDITSVTSELSFVDNSASVSKISETGSNWISYYDIPLYSDAVGKLFYNTDQENAKLMAEPDGSNPQLISKDPKYRNTHTRPIFISNNGRFAYFVHTNVDGASVDLFFIRLISPGPCKEQRLTQLTMDIDTTVQVSTASLDARSGKSIIAFADGPTMRRVMEDGTMLPDVSLPDSESRQNFHRLRMNPKFPNLVFYRRNAIGSHTNTKSLYIVDLNHPGKAYDVAAQIPQLIHPLWSPDGLQLGFISKDKQWHVMDIARQDGSLKVKSGRFSSRAVGPRPEAQLDLQFCSWAPDRSKYVCVTREAGTNNKVFLMSSDGLSVRALVSTDTGDVGDRHIQGNTWAQFVQDTRHIVFHSTRTGESELYLIDCPDCGSF